jgi:hypothetical protein
LAADLRSLELPAVARALAQDAAVVPLIHAVSARLLQEPGLADGVAERARFHLRARERARDRIRYTARLALTPTVADWAAVPIPVALGFFHRVLRPIRLVSKFGPRALATLLGLGSRARLRAPRADAP